jgi:hypothetical protein
VVSVPKKQEINIENKFVFKIESIKIHILFGFPLFLYIYFEKVIKCYL